MVVIKMVTLQLLLHVDQQQNARESEFDNTQVLKAQNLICMLPLKKEGTMYIMV
jgi:hypothetical protein